MLLRGRKDKKKLGDRRTRASRKKGQKDVIEIKRTRRTADNGGPILKNDVLHLHVRSDSRKPAGKNGKREGN